jgi:acyl-CoA synthetase (AMP-forming)/AMP-acid ligase II
MAYAERGDLDLGWLLKRGAGMWGDKVAVVEQERRFTYSEFDRWSEQIGAVLGAAGLRTGDPVLIFSPNNSEMLAAQVGCWRTGMVAAPVIPIYRAHELRQIITDLRPQAIVAVAELGDRQPCREIDEVLPNAGVDPLVKLSIGGRPSDGWKNFPALDETTVTAADLGEPADPEATCFMLFTSGSTSAPKGVRISSAAVMSAVGIYAQRLPITEDDVALAMAPLSHIAGLTPGFFVPMTNGGTTVILPRWRAPEAVELIAREKITYTGGATVFLDELVDQYEAGNDHGHRLRRFFSGGAATPVSLVQRADAAGVWVGRVYGMTECSGIVSMPPADASLELRATWDGLLADNVEIKAVDGDGVELPAGEEGNLRIKGPMLLLGYTDPVATKHQLVDGWFDPGDVGVVSSDRWLKITGRTKDIINRGGEKFAARDIEDALLGHSSITRAAVIPIADQRLGEAVCAFLTVTTGVRLTPQQVSDFLIDQGLAKAKVPVETYIIDELPVSSTGKIEKKKLVALRDELFDTPVEFTS